MRVRMAVGAMLLFVPLAGAQGQEPRVQGQRAFEPADWYRLSTLSSPALSPDGRRVAFTVTTVKEAENRRHSEIWVVPATGGEPVRYTSPSHSSSNPRWSPDGRYLFFTSNRPGGKGNTWALRADGPGEAFQLEHYPSGSVPRDGRFAVWAEPEPRDTAQAGGESRADAWRGMQPMARPPFDAVTRPLDARRFDGMHITQTRYKGNNIGFIPGPREAPSARPAQLWKQAFADTVKRQLTHAAYSHRSPVVSPDGRWIAFLADARLRPDSVVAAERDSLALLPFDLARDQEIRNDVDVFVISVAGGEPRRVAELPGNESALTWSPDSRRLAFVSSTRREDQNRLYVIDVQGGQPRELLGDWQFEPASIEWLPNGRIAMSAAVGGRTAFFSVDPRTGQRREVLEGRRRLSGFSYDARGNTVAYVSTSVDRPTELYIARTDGRGERRLTGFNDALNAEIAWSPAERFTYESVGGLEIEGWLMPPYGYEPGRQYPLVLYIHGGPHSAYGENWFDEFQNLAGAGMWVLYTNPRGSSSYGAAFTYSTRGDWGGDDYLDIMKAVDIASRRPDVDSTRLGVTGGSYGGFMTAWITTKTDRFRAAQADRMISNWWSWYGSSDAQGLTEWEFFGRPWDNPLMYDTLSPIRFADRVTTPTLIVQSEEDHRTPMTDAEQWFVALRKNGVPVEFVRYPRSTHDLSRTGEPWLLVDRLGRLRQWFTHWLGEN
jgi:dipeptidyl aminopeptidase/acylaminoacyl peptidase